MADLAASCRRTFKHYSEAIAIVAFILADCFASGWFLIAGTIAALLYAVVPALRGMWGFTPIEQVTFLKAYVKTRRLQQVALMLFWLYSIRFLVYATSVSMLFTVTTQDNLPSLSNALLLGAQQFAPLAFLATPVIFYLVACLVAVMLRSRLKATKKDPDLVQQRQRWCGSSQFLFLSAFVGGILSITMNLHGPAYMISNWMLTSARDANLFDCGTRDEPWEELTAESSHQRVAGQSAADKAKVEQSKNSLGTAVKSYPDQPGGSTALEISSAEPSAAVSQDTSPVPPEVPSGDVTDSTDLTSDSVPTDYGFTGSQTCSIGYAIAPYLQGVIGPETSKLSFMEFFDVFVISALSGILFVVFLKPILKVNAFLSSFCWRVVSPWSLQNHIEAFLEALRLPSRTLTFDESHPLMSNALRTLAWLLVCYGGLWWIFGFCGGPLGDAIHNWMMASALDAGFSVDEKAPLWLYQPPLRIFLGSIVALYGTAPIAISAAVFLPCATARKITINCDGILLSQGPYLALLGRQFRLWSDFESMSVKTEKSRSGIKAMFTIKFRSAGHVTFTNAQMSGSDLEVLLGGIDEHASHCFVDPRVYEVCRTLCEAEGDTVVSDGINNNSISAIPAQDFKSTIFVPFSPGDFLPGTQTRVIKQLSSKPLCAVYLARDESGRMLTVKQFFLASDDGETRALAKIFQREYELLSNLDHPGIAKIADSFTYEKSTFLLIEHRLGSDMREVVNEHGPRSEAITIEWAKQLATIMIYLHGREPAITHRDLTPDNVIVGEDGQLRLIDFGAAREFLEGITGTMLGKHCYVAPEQLRGEATPRSDVYSFGGTLFYLLTGQDPVALSQSCPKKFIECSDELDRLIRQCTEFDESKRPVCFEDVLNSLSEMNKGFRLKIPKVKEKASV